jgi:hypothetical protein
MTAFRDLTLFRDTRLGPILGKGGRRAGSMKFIAAPIVFPALFCVTGELWAADVDLEVILATGASRSIDESEFESQRKRYAAALAGPRMPAAIHRQPHGAINGLAILNNRADRGYSAHTHPPGGLARYYRTPVIGGSGAFLVVVENFNSFAEAMAKKPAREIDLAARGTTRPMAVGQ